MAKSKSKKKSSPILQAAIFAVGVIAIAVWVYVQFFSVPPGADANNAAQVAIGQAVYTDHCAACHGDKLQGQPNWRQRKPDGKLPAPPHDRTGHTWHHADQVLFNITKNGTAATAPPGYQTDMGDFGSTLTDDEIWSVLAFIKSTWPPDIQARQARLNK